MAVLLPPPDFFSNPYPYIFQARDILWEVPLAVGAIILLTFLVTWALFHFLHQQQLNDLRERLRLRDDQNANLKAQLTAPPASSGIFEIEARDCFFSWINTNKEELSVHPDIPKPTEASLLIRITTLITAIPPRILSMVELEILRKRYSQVVGSWEPHHVGPVSFERYLHFELPPTVPSGTHSAKLIAYCSDLEKTSSPFNITVPR